ncbi:MAG: thioredoxin [Pseudomonadota bacterium]
MSANPTPDSAWLFPVTAQDFEARVVNADVPVLIDFWAPWCGPCQQIAPVLDALVARYQGGLYVAKVNVDEEQALAAGFGVRSIPMLVLFHQGQVVETMVGLQPEQQLADIIDRYVGGPPAADTGIANTLPADDPATAVAMLRDALDKEGPQPHLIAELARTELALGEVDAATATVARLPDDTEETAELQQLKLQLDFASRAAELPEPAALMETLNAREDAQARYQLAIHQAAAGATDDALLSLMTVLRIDMGFADGAAKATLLQVFELAGGSDPSVQQTRRQLASLLH